MHIEHLAIWTKELETMRQFYETYFSAISNDQYHNPAKAFRSYFLSFATGARLELMHTPKIAQQLADWEAEQIGLAHFALSVGSQPKVDQLTSKLQAAGFPVIGKPRWTGDGYYESVVLDPENNRIEITI